MTTRKMNRLGTLAFGLVLAFGALGTATAGDGKSCGGKKGEDKSAAVTLPTAAMATQAIG